MSLPPIFGIFTKRVKFCEVVPGEEFSNFRLFFAVKCQITLVAPENWGLCTAGSPGGNVANGLAYIFAKCDVLSVKRGTVAYFAGEDLYWPFWKMYDF